MDVIEREYITENEVKLLLTALMGLKKGDSSVRLPLEWTGLTGKLAETFNDVVELNENMAQELARLRQTVGKQGKLPWPDFLAARDEQGGGGGLNAARLWHSASRLSGLRASCPQG